MVKSGKKIIIMSALFVFAFIMTTSAFCQDIKLGWLNSLQILNEYSEAIEVQKKIDQERVKIQNQLQDMQDELERKTKELENQSLLLSDERKMEMQKEIEALYIRGQQLQLQQFGPEGELVKRQDQLMEPIIEKIQEVINKIAEDEKYDWIFDSSKGTILFIKDQEKYDITQAVIDELNKGAKK